MRAPSTMIITADEDERTLIDPRFTARDRSSDVTAFAADPAGSCAADLPFAGSGQAQSSAGQSRSSDECADPRKTLWQRLRPQLSIRDRGFLTAGLLLAIIVGLALAVHRQLRVAHQLRQALDDMSAGGSSPSHEHSGSSNRLAAALHPKVFPDSRERELAERDREALENRGASLVASNDFVHALAHYQMLTQMFPGEDTFRDFVTVLHAKLACENPDDAAGLPCL